ncbi:ABC transporter ATP-binding protein [Clostridium pasteurianum]|uniref:ABC-type multidrug transport system, ATPase component n=1 Tax=Clostridium pasteurianum BC1 TaxID=86416 RepID=R4KAG9_CLOPA|nr:ABC transporter ATP-binding protein [Clostridium pasteurianum]AGK96635.1 ABC-type multidrug transport system, ATPase component [Clostridium pasteurianum BC1]
MNNIIRTINLTKKIKEVTIVNKININLEQGDIYGFLGPNGSGKSTTIKMMLGLVKPTEGRVEINGYDVWKDKKKALNSIGAMIENPSFYDYLSGYKNLELYKNLYDLPKTRINEVLNIVGLEKEKNKKVKKYSLGMKQRLAIARAFINYPKIVILDEPTNGLDPVGVVEIRNLIRDLSVKENINFIICSHILSEIQELCNKVSIINKGELISEGYVKDLLNQEFDEYFIDTSDLQKAKVILEKFEVVKSISIHDNIIQINIDKGKIGEINKKLALNDIDITSIKKKENTLESYFLSTL